MATVNTDSTASPNEIRNPIKCTYDKCFQRFASVEAMTKHKVAASKKNPGDDIHDFYCKKCDENCEDDNEYFIHQLTAPASKHSRLPHMKVAIQILSTVHSCLSGMWSRVQEHWRTRSTCWNRELSLHTSQTDLTNNARTTDTNSGSAAEAAT